MNELRNILDYLTKKRVIRGFYAVRRKSRRLYILSELEPAKSLTGGTFYNSGDLDINLLETLSDIVVFVLLRAREWVSFSRIVRFFGTSTNLSTRNTSLNENDLISLLGLLIYKGKIEKIEGILLLNKRKEMHYRISSGAKFDFNAKEFDVDSFQEGDKVVSLDEKVEIEMKGKNVTLKGHDLKNCIIELQTGSDQLRKKTIGDSRIFPCFQCQIRDLCHLNEGVVTPFNCVYFQVSEIGKISYFVDLKPKIIIVL